MAVLIVLIGCTAGVLSSYLKARKRVDPRILKRLEDLEEQIGNESLVRRVEALEAIVTDEKRRLDQEIRSL